MQTNDPQDAPLEVPVKFKVRMTLIFNGVRPSNMEMDEVVSDVECQSNWTTPVFDNMRLGSADVVIDDVEVDCD